jgi:hypothetical protein
MEHSGMGIDDLLSNSSELFAITGLHRSDLQGEDDSDDSTDEIEEYFNELELHDEEDMDYEPEEEPLLHSSTPVRSTHTEDESITPDESDMAPIRQDIPTTWSDSFTHLMIETFLPTSHGLAQAFTASNTALDAFQKFFDMSLFENIAEETNRYATQKQETHPDPTACGTCPNLPCMLISWNPSENILQWLQVM